MLFVLSYSFQISGAVILLLGSLSATNKKILAAYFSAPSVVLRDDNDMCMLSKKELQKACRPVYQNIVAFINLVIGYSLAIFAEKQYENCRTFILVVCITILVIAIEYATVYVLAWVRYRSDKQVPFAEIHKHQPHIATVMTEKELDDILSK